MKTPRILTAAAIGMFMTMTACYALDAAAQTTPASTHSMRLAVFGGPVKSLCYDMDGQKTAIETTAGALSCEMPMPKGKTLQFFRQVAPPAGSPAGTPVRYQSVGAIELPECQKAIVMMLLPSDLDKQPIRGRAFADSYQLHRSETARVFNMSGKMIGVQAGKDSLQLPPGEIGVLPWKAVRFNCSNFRVGFQDSTGKPKVLAGGEAAARPGLRYFIFVTERSPGGPMSVITALDAIPESPKG